MKLLNNYLLIERITPVIQHLFKLYNIKHHYQSIYTFEQKKTIKWVHVVNQLKSVLESVNLDCPKDAINDPIDFCDQLLMQMINDPAFKKEHINYMHSVIDELFDSSVINISIIFKLALALNDGHGLHKLVMRKQNLILTNKISISLDRMTLHTFFDGYCDHLSKKRFEQAANALCQFMIYTLCNFYDQGEKEQLIKLIQKKIFFVYQRMEKERLQADPF